MRAGMIINDTQPTGVQTIAQTASALGVYGNVFLGVVLGQINAAPSGVVTWGGVVVEYE